MSTFKIAKDPLGIIHVMVYDRTFDLEVNLELMYSGMVSLSTVTCLPINRFVDIN